MALPGRIDPFSVDLEPLEPLDQTYQPFVDHIADDMAATNTFEGTFGTNPIKVWPSRKTGRLMVIDGHHRLKAARQAKVFANLVQASQAHAEQILRLQGRLNEL